jgi:K+-transporting ATPase ATPase C chain
MIANLKRSILSCIIFLILCGLIYPLIGTAIGQTFFKFQANGSQIKQGSLLVEQSWNGPEWFQGRNDGSVLTVGKDNIIISGTNQPGPRSKALIKSVKQRAEKLLSEGILPKNDLVTTSGSLIDPDITVAAAEVQVPAVAKFHHLKQEVLYKLIAQNTVQKQFGFLGNSYVNVLELNLALSKLNPTKLDIPKVNNTNSGNSILKASRVNKHYQKIQVNKTRT